MYNENFDFSFEIVKNFTWAKGSFSFNSALPFEKKVIKKYIVSILEVTEFYTCNFKKCFLLLTAKFSCKDLLLLRGGMGNSNINMRFLNLKFEAILNIKEQTKVCDHSHVENL